MRKRTLHIIVLVFVIQTNMFSQVGPFISVSPTISTLKPKGLSSFFTSYNDFFKNVVNEGFSENISFLKGYSILGGYSVNGFFEGGLGFVENFGRNTATYNNGDKQILLFKQRDILVDMNIGTNLENPIKFSWDLGIMFSNQELRLYYEHNNGVKDYHGQYYASGGRNWLNGFYKAWSLSFYTGFSLGTNINEGAYSIFLRGDYVFKPTGGIDFKDEEPSKQSTPSFSGGRPNLPSDVGVYYTGLNSENTFNTIEIDVSHIRLMLSFQINIGAIK